MLKTRKEIAELISLDDFLASDLGKNKTNIPVIFCVPHGFADSYSWITSEECLYLGDVMGMEGHGVFVSKKTGLMKWGYHTDNFYIDKCVIQDLIDQNERHTMEEHDGSEEDAES
jgi:hypothetical protein